MQNALAGWDDDILAIELQHLTEVVVDFDVTVTGFEMPAIDLIIEKAKAPKPEDEVQPIDRTGAAVTRRAISGASARTAFSAPTP
jgi:hypothetical protein